MLKPMQKPPDLTTGAHTPTACGLGALPWLLRLALIVAIVAPCLLVSAAVLMLLTYLAR